MKRMKILIALLVVLTLLASMATLFVSAASPEYLYLTPNANWKTDNARFAAYFFGNGETWVSMTDSNGDGVYEVKVPTDKTYPSVIFCRMNPGASANNWNNKWNQTADLTVPTDGPNHYTVKEGTWDKGGGTWATFGSTCAHANLSDAATCTTDQTCLDCGDPVVSALGHSYNSAHLCTRCNEQASFTVAGTGAHLGIEWDTTNTANDMTYADGVYTKVYTNVAAGSYKLKVARDHDWGTAYPSADKSYTVATAGSTVTVTLKGTTVTVVVEAPHVCEFVAGEVVAPTFEADGYTVYTCSGCGKTENRDIVPALVAVAQVGDVKYADIQEAIKAAAPAGTVELLSDVTVDTWIMIAEKLSIGNGKLITLNVNGMTIDGNDYTLTVNAVESAGNGSYLFYDAENLNVQDLTINLAGSVAGIGLQSGNITNVTFEGGSYGVIPGAGAVTIEGCTFKTNSSAIYYEQARDHLVVNNNTFELASNANVILLRGAEQFTNNTVVSGRTVNVVSGSPVVSGNNFGDVRLKVYNVAKATISNNTINNLVFDDDTTTYTVFEGNTLSESAEAALEAVLPVYVAQIGDVKYESLAAAIEAAQAGETVLVYEGTYAVPSMKAGITIEGQGSVLFEGTLSGSLNNLTLKNIHIKGSNAQRWAYASGDLVFENVTFEATSVYALHFDGIAEGTNLLYKNCTIIGWAAMGGSPASCVFDGCTIKGNGSYGVIRTYFDATIENCTFDVSNVNPDDVYQDGIHSVAATVTVNNCTNVNGEMADIVNVSNGESVPAYVVVDGEEIHVHSRVQGETVAPDCTEAGYTPYSCPCGHVEKEDVVSALGHKDTGLDAKCDTCGKFFVPAGAFKLEVYQHNKKSTYYFKGSMSGYYFATTSANSLTGAVDVYAEETDGGYYLYFLKGTTKNYLYIQISGSYTNIKYGTTKAVWAFNETFGTFTTVVNGTTYYMGTYNNYVTISASKISYLSASNMDVSQFPARPVSLVDHVCTKDSVSKVVAPTCVAEGYTEYKCNNCSQKFKADYVSIDPAAHSFKNGSIFCSLCDALHPDWVSVNNNEALAAYAKVANTKICLEAGTYSVPSIAAGVHIYGNGEVLLEGTLSNTLDSITLENLHIKGANAQRWAYAKGDLVFNNVTFEATSVYALHFDGIAEGTTLLYKDCTIIGWAAMGGSPESCVFDGCTIKGNGRYGLIRTYFDATIENCTFDVSNVNPDDVYQDGIHAVDATVTVNNCTNVNGDMKEIIDTSDVGYVVLDGETIHIHKYEDFVCPCGYEFRASIGEVEYPTISAAIEAAVDGDVITILPGVHTEVIKHSDYTNRFGGKNITIVGAENYGTVLTGGLYIGYDDSNPYTGSVTVKGIAFEGKGLSLVQLDSASVVDCKFTNIATEDKKSAILVICDGNTKTATITGNVVDGAYIGIRVRNALELLIDGNEVSNTEHNSITVEQGSAYAANTYPLTITNNTFKNWGLSGEGRAIRVALGKMVIARTGSTSTAKNVTIANNIFVNENAPEEFIKMTDVDSSMDVTVESNVFEGNVPSGLDYILLEGTGADNVDTENNPDVEANEPHILDGYWWIGTTNTGVKAEGVDGHTPVITIVNGNWHIDGVDTGVKAEAVDGETPYIKDGNWWIGDNDTGVKAEGVDGHSPVITIVDGKWHIDGVDTGIKAEAIDGVDGETPYVKDGNWWIGDSDTGVKAEGIDGHTPIITIVNGKWYVDGVDTGVKAEGIDGKTPVIEIKDGKWYIDGVESGWAIITVVSVELTQTNGLVDTYTVTLTDGTTYTFNVTNGADGEDGKDGQDGATGPQGPIGNPGPQGNSGLTPYIKEVDGVKYWFIGDVNTGVRATGETGADGNDNNKVVVVALAIATVSVIIALAVLLYRGIRRRTWWH